MVLLRITMFGVTELTKRIEPIFPLLFHERFHFRKIFPEASSLSELANALKRNHTHIELIQIPENKCRSKLLASFKRSMVEVLTPPPAEKGLVMGVDVDLLMQRTDCFPGIISPKVEISTRIAIEEVVKPAHEPWVINPVTVSSCKSPDVKNTKGKTIKEQKSPIRQKQVCHRRQKAKCICCKQNISSPLKTTGKTNTQLEGINKAKGDMENKCYCCLKCGKDLDVEYHGEVLRKDETKEKNNNENTQAFNTSQHSKSSCDCCLCQKYNHVFSCSCKSAEDILASSDLSTLKGYPCTPSPVLLQKKVNSGYCASGKSFACPQKRSHSPTRVYHCFCKEPVNCCYKAYTIKNQLNPWLDKSDTDILRRQDDQSASYRQLFYNNLESYYHKLYKRVCTKNNQEDSHCVC